MCQKGLQETHFLINNHIQRRTDPITKKKVQGARLQTTKKIAIYLHKTIHLDRQSYAQAYTNTHARAHTQLLNMAEFG